MLAMMPPMPPRSHLVEDFSGRATGSLVGQGWSHLDASTNVSFTVALSGASISGRRVDVDKTVSEETRRLSFGLAGSPADVEVLVRVLPDEFSANSNTQVNVRATAAPGGYYAELISGSQGILRITGENEATYIDDAAISLTADIWYWRRVRINGSNFMARTWQYGTSEPSSWQVSGTASGGPASGAVGMGTYDDALDYAFDYFSVALDGATAPFPAG